jgi:hypothetical protein
MSVRTFDFDSPESNTVDTIKVSTPSVETFDFDSTVVQDYSFVVKFHAINRYYSVDNRNMEKLLNDINIVTRGSNMYCPFHDDELSGKPSAKYHPDSDMIYCFSESKVYTAYHALKELYAYDMNKIFKDAWRNLSDCDKEEIIRKYGDENNIDKKEFIDPKWKELIPVVTQFMMGNVTFKKHKIALYKVMSMIAESRIPKKKEEEAVFDDNSFMLPD